MNRSIAVRMAAILTATIALVGVPAPAANAATLSAPLADGLAGPLQLAVGSDGTVYVSQSFAGVLSTLGKHGNTVLATNPVGEIAGIAAEGRGTVTYTASNQTSATLNRVLPNGRTSVLADLRAFEETVNPDQVNTYGFIGLTPACDEEVTAALGFPATYNGIVDAHPYAVDIVGGTRYVADAAGNVIERVDANGRVSVVAVLPPQPFYLPVGAAAGLGLPDCAEGHFYNFEPVPTDVEAGPDGLLYVSTLPGGPEDPSLGARGSVYTVNPSTGAVNRIATGFLGATNVAVGSDGSVYVAELFAGRVSKVVAGGPQTVVELPFPAGLEIVGNTLYVSYDVFGNGSIATIAL